MPIEYLYRYPVKGLSAEALEATEVAPGGAIPWDRAFALAQGDSGFDPARPEFRAKYHFMCLMKNARIAGLRTLFDARSGRLTVTAPDGSGVAADALSAAGRAEIGAFLGAYLGAEARGAPEFVHVPGHVFGDQRGAVVSLIGLASWRDYEARVGARRHRRRFRANVWFSGAGPFAELDWVGRDLQMGGAVLRVRKRIARCPATEVNPGTAQRDADPVAELHALYGHSDLGIVADVIEGGKFAVGDAIALLPE